MEQGVANLRRKIAATVREAEWTGTEAWNDLLRLAPAPMVDAVETFEDEIQIEGTKFSGALLWYVTLTYGPPDDQIVSSESFPGKFEGHIHDDTPSIDRITIDTASFYA